MKKLQQTRIDLISVLPGKERRSPGIEVLYPSTASFNFKFKQKGMNNSFFHCQLLKTFFSSWFINKNEKKSTR